MKIVALNAFYTALSGLGFSSVVLALFPSLITLLISGF